MKKRNFILYSVSISAFALCFGTQTAGATASPVYTPNEIQQYAVLSADEDDGTIIRITEDKVTYWDEMGLEPEYDLASHIHQNEKVKKIILPANVGTVLPIDAGEIDGQLIENFQSLTPDCPNLSEIEVAPENTYLKTIDGVLYSKDGTILYYCPPGKTGALVIPEGVKKIYLMAFQECEKLTSITFPSTLSYIADGAFGDTKELSSITVSSENDYFTVKDQVLFSKDMDRLYLYPGGKSASYYTVPNGVITIHSTAFAGNAYLKKLTAPGTLTTIENEAFKNCTSLKTVVITKGLLDIDAGAFLNCSALKNINLPYGIRGIYRDAFSGCNNLKTISYPKSVMDLSGTPELFAGSVVKFYSPYIGSIRLADGVKASDITVYAYKGSLVAKQMLERGVKVKYYATEYTVMKSASTVPKGTVSGKGTPDTSWYEKSKSTYSISTPDELAGLAKLVNSGDTFSGKKVILKKDLNMSCYPNWIPIGTDNGMSLGFGYEEEDVHQFKGTLDGGNHTIYNLRINRIDTYEVGLFGVLTGTVENLTISDADVLGESHVGILAGIAPIKSSSITNCHISGRVNGYENIGGLFGGNHGTITSCTADVTMYGISTIGGISGSGSAEITNCTVEGLVGGLYELGGIVGDNRGTIKNCENKSDVPGHLSAGGISGMLSDGEIINCTNSGDIRAYDNAGGIVGGGLYFDGDVTDCVNTGAVTGNNNIGGIAGYLSCGSLHTCMNTGDISGISCVGGILGVLGRIYPETDRVFDCTNKGTVTGSRYVDDQIGISFHF